MIEFLLVDKEKCKQLEDVTAMPREDFEGDHKIVIGKFRLGKISELNETRERKIKVWKLKENKIREKFQEDLKRLIPKGEIGRMEEEWTYFKQGFVKCAEHSCGRVSSKKKEKKTP